MPVNLSALGSATTSANALAGLVLVTPQSVVGYQPQNPPDDDGEVSLDEESPAFLFDYEGEQKVILESDITDHYAEDNLSIEDMIALKPERYVTRGFVGELNDVVPALLKPLKLAADKLLIIGSYTPDLTLTALIAYQNAQLAYDTVANVANAAVAAWSTVGNAFSGNNGQNVIGANGIVVDEDGNANSSPQNKQQVAFQKFYGYWRSKTLFTVQTPWAVFQNMAIARCTPTQGEETNTVSEFEIEFKMIRFASSTLVGGLTGLDASNSPSMQNYAAAQAAGATNLGISSPSESIGLGDGLATMGVA